MDTERKDALSKVPQVTLIFWIIKIFATTLGETGGDAVSMSMNLGHPVGTAIFAVIFVVAVMASLYVWHRVMGSIDVSTVASPKTEAFYWTTIMFSQTLGTALGDWTSDTASIGYAGSALIFGGLLALLVLAYYFTRINRVGLFWAAWR